MFTILFNSSLKDINKQGRGISTITVIADHIFFSFFFNHFLLFNRIDRKKEENQGKIGRIRDIQLNLAYNAWKCRKGDQYLHYQ